MEDKKGRDGHPPTEIDPGMLQLNSAVRRIINATRLADPPAGLAGEIAVRLDHLAGRLEPYAHLGTIAQGSLRNDSNPVEKRFGSPADFFPYSPAVGPLNPIAPPMDAVVVDGELFREVRASGILEAPYVGPPDIVQGGVIALLFDDILGIALVANDCGAMTGTLTVRYEAPTPIRTELLWVGRLETVEERRVVASGELWAQGVRTATAEGVFIRVDLLEDRHPST